MAFVVGEVAAGITADPSRFHAALQDTHRAGQNWATQMGARFTKVGQQMTQVGRQMSMYVTAPILGAGAASLKASMDFEESMSHIIGLVGVSSEQVGKWRDDLLRMGPELGKTPTELAEALFFVTSAGFRGAEALEVLEISAKGSAAGLGETKVVADLLTSAINAYGAENLNAEQAADILTAAVREGKAEASELAAVMGNVLPIAAELGVSFDQVGAATAAMTKTGTDAATASTQLRQILASLLKPTQQAEEALEMMGISSSELRDQLGTEGLYPVLDRLRGLTNQYGEETMAKVFPNIRALAGVLDLVGSNAEENEKTFYELANATGALDHAFSTAAETGRFQWNRALAGMQGAAITLGDAVQKAVIPVMEDFTAWIGRVTQWFQNLDEEQQQNILRWAGIIAAVGPVLIIFGTLAKAVGSVITLSGTLASGVGTLAKVVLPGLGGAAGAAGAKVGLLGAAGGPIALAALAIGGIAISINNSRKRFRDLTSDARELEGAMDDTASAFDNAQSSFENTAGRILASTDLASDYITRLEELEKAGLETNEQQREYAGIVERLRDMFPDLNLEIDKQTGLLVDGTDALEDQIRAWRDYAIQQAGQKMMTELYESHTEAMIELIMAERRLEEVENEIADKRRQRRDVYVKLLEELGMSHEEFTRIRENGTMREREALGRAIHATGELGESYNNLGRELNDLETTYEALSGEVETSREKVDEWGDTIKDTEEALDTFYGRLGDTEDIKAGQDALDDYTKSADGLAGTAYKAGRNAGRATGDGFVRGVNERRQAVTRAVSQMAESVNNTFRQTMLISSPSRRAAGWADDTVAGFVNRLSQLRAPVADAVAGLASGLDIGLDMPAASKQQHNINFHHTLDLRNVPHGTDSTELRRMVAGMLEGIDGKRLLDRVGYSNYIDRARAQGVQS